MRVWFVACERAGRPSAEFAARVRELERSGEIRRRLTESAEFAARLGLPREWNELGVGALDEVLASDDDGSILWLATPSTIARALLLTLNAPTNVVEKLEPRVHTLTAVDRGRAADAARRPSLVGFELDWFPPSGGGAFPGAAPRA